MDTNIRKVRKDYLKQELLRSDLPRDPMELLEGWMADAASTDASDYNAMCLSTANKSGSPSSRIVLVRSISEMGIRFFTNYRSQKGRDIEENPNVSVNFFWKEWERQIRIEGAAVKCSSEISDSYFASRPRGSQEGAWTSMQSAANVSPMIEERVKSTVAQFKETDVIPRPDFWGGYDIKIQSIEFWQGRPSRLHNRWKYLRDDSSATQWGISRLDP